jgi:hypothetical protein
MAGAAKRTRLPASNAALQTVDAEKGTGSSVTYEKTRRSPACIAITAVLGVFTLPAGTSAQSSSTTSFSGQAYVVRATVPPLAPITIVDTGPLPSEGGAQEASLLEVAPIPLANVGALNGAQVAHASTVGQGNASRSEASVADLSLTLAGNTISADFLMSQASAQCSGSSPAVSGGSDLATLVINNQTIAISGATNQTVPLPLNAGSVVINEQSSSTNGRSGTMDVNALHVVINNPTSGARVADVIVSHAHADITCPASPPPRPPCAGASTDFVTGGGWIVSPSDPKAKANFAVAGGIKNGLFWGHLMYIDHGNGPRVKGLAVSGYGVYPPFGPNGRQTLGSADVSGATARYEADVADNGEPGRGRDKFQLWLDDVLTASDVLAGGNIQLHKPDCQ